jgi:hypothetical protein
LDNSNSLARHQTWQLIPRPPNRKTVSTKWVFKLKDTLPPIPYHLLSTITTPVTSATVISTDSQSALEYVKNNIRHACTKHIDARHHFIRNIYTAGEIDLVHVPSDLQAADILTKALSRTKHDQALPLTRLQSLPVKRYSRKIAFIRL